MLGLTHFKTWCRSGWSRCVGEAYLLVLGCPPEGQASNLIPIWGHAGVLSKDRDWWCHLCALSPSSMLWVSPREELLLVSGAPVFVAATMGHLYIAWHLWPVGLMLAVPWDCIYFHILNSCTLSVWIPISLNLGVEIQSIGTQMGLGTFSTTRSYKI